MMAKTPFSAVIIAANDERTIAQVLTALNNVAAEIIVVLDDRSTDNTAQICKELGTQVVVSKWRGFSIGKNHGAQMAKHDWILCFDADEVIDDTIVSHLKQLHAQNDTVYYFNILTYIGNKPILHSGWHPDWNIRLYNKKVMQWSDDYVHEKLIKLDPKVELEPQKLAGVVHHYSFKDWAHMDSKYEYYARMRSQEWLRRGKSPTVIKRAFSPSFRFVKKFFIQLGFLDGMYGYKLASKEYHLKRKEHIYYRILKAEGKG